MLEHLKHKILGDPLPNAEYKHQRLSKKVALAVFSSDALSSVAYATEEIVLVLFSVGAAALAYTLPVTLVIIFLLWVLIMSYRQTIQAYPNGGGAYIVAKDNLGTIPGLVAGSALLLDYILTVAVSVAAGVAAVTSAFPFLYPEKVLIGVSVVAFIAIMQLKGVRESGIVFSIPTYIFIFSFILMILVGLFKYFTGTLTTSIVYVQAETFSAVSIFLLLRAFSSGCTALTGVEAISNGIPAFQEPESTNARKTILYMAVIMTFLFFGVSFLAYHMGITPAAGRTMVSLIAENLFGKGIFFYIIQACTMLILFLAANTSFADFPRLASFLAKDKFLPNQFTRLGERLVFSNGIIMLGIFSCILLIMFNGDVHLLIPLYAVGVFTSFTLSQSGMVIRHLRIREKHWQSHMLINLLGAIMSGVAMIIIAVTKFMHGAWMIVILIILLVIFFLRINKHYTEVAEQLSISNVDVNKILAEPAKHMFVVLVPSLHRGIVEALHRVRNMCDHIVAVHINIGGPETERLIKYWEKYNPGVRLVVIDSPYRQLIGPLMTYLDKIEAKAPKLHVTVVVSEFIPRHIWQMILHNQTAQAIKLAIHFRKRTDFISIRYHLDR